MPAKRVTPIMFRNVGAPTPDIPHILASAPHTPPSATAPHNYAPVWAKASFSLVQVSIKGASRLGSSSSGGLILTSQSTPSGRQGRAVIIPTRERKRPVSRNHTHPTNQIRSRTRPAKHHHEGINSYPPRPQAFDFTRTITATPPYPSTPFPPSA